jgi:hypothetical protein
MIRRLLPGFALMLLVGCQSVQEQEAIRPLRENGPKLTYDELLLRARKQSELAMDRSFRNLWPDVQDVATALEQTVKLMPTAPQIPEKKDDILKLCSSLEKDAQKLNTAAKQVMPLKDKEREEKIKEVDGLLLNISRNVRTLWATTPQP